MLRQEHLQAMAEVLASEAAAPITEDARQETQRLDQFPGAAPRLTVSVRPGGLGQNGNAGCGCIC
jgi:hypothetical protein